MPPTAGVDIWLYSEWEGFVQGEDLRLDSIRENHIYVSGHYNNKVASDNYKIHLGKFEAGEYQIVYTAVDDSDIMPDVANYIPLTVNEIAVDGASEPIIFSVDKLSHCNPDFVFANVDFYF